MQQLLAPGGALLRRLARGGVAGAPCSGSVCSSSACGGGVCSSSACSSTSSSTTWALWPRAFSTGGGAPPEEGARAHAAASSSGGSSGSGDAGGDGAASSSAGTSGSGSSGAAAGPAPRAGHAQPEGQRRGGAAGPGDSSAAVAAASPSPSPEEERADRLMRVLLHPISRTRRWKGQLSGHLVHVNGQLLAEPQAVLTSMLRALHVFRGVLQEDGHVYVVETNPLLRPLLREAARSCVNPNVWFMETTWSRGTITNHASHRRLFLPAHQPNRRLFIEKGLRMVNPHHPEPKGPPPRLDWADKWALYTHTRQPGYRGLLEDLLRKEQALHTLKPPRTLPGRARDLRLLIVLDTTRNAIALAEAAMRGVPTVALASGQADMADVTYPVLARDFSPEFVHFFLDMLVRVANVAPAPRGEEDDAEDDSAGGHHQERAQG